MTYNEWRDELKSNLLNVSESERYRVLDYYAEAYADRRDAGYSERQIIEDFGAPYDAAQRILLNICDDSEECEVKESVKNVDIEKNTYKDRHSKFSKKHENVEKVEPKEVKAEVVNDYPFPEKRKHRSIILILVCVLFSVPLFGMAVGLIGLLSAFLLAPLGCFLASGISIVIGIIELFTSTMSGIYTIGEGILSLGIGLVLLPLCIMLIKLLAKAIKKLFKWLGRLLSGKEYAR